MRPRINGGQLVQKMRLKPTHIKINVEGLEEGCPAGCSYNATANSL
jgi:hypothetical protein